MAVSPNTDDSQKSNKKTSAKATVQEGIQSAARGQLNDDITLLGELNELFAARLKTFGSNQRSSYVKSLLAVLSAQVKKAEDWQLEELDLGKAIELFYNEGEPAAALQLLSPIEELVFDPAVSAMLSKHGQIKVTETPELVYEAVANEFAKTMTMNEANFVVRDLHAFIYSAIGKRIPMRPYVGR